MAYVHQVLQEGRSSCTLFPRTPERRAPAKHQLLDLPLMTCSRVHVVAQTLLERSRGVLTPGRYKGIILCPPAAAVIRTHMRFNMRMFCTFLSGTGVPSDRHVHTGRRHIRTHLWTKLRPGKVIKDHKNTCFYMVFGCFRSPRPYDHMEYTMPDLINE